MVFSGDRSNEALRPLNGSLAPRQLLQEGDSHQCEPDVGHMPSRLQRGGSRLEVALPDESCESGEELVNGRASDQYYDNTGPGGKGAGCQRQQGVDR